MNLRGLLVQSSKWFGISSVQFSYLVTSLSGKFVSSVRGMGTKFLRSVQFTVQARFSYRALSIEHSIVWEEQRNSSRGPLQQKSQPAGPRFVAWVEGWCALLSVLAFSSGMW